MTRKKATAVVWVLAMLLGFSGLLSNFGTTQQVNATPEKQTYSFAVPEMLMDALIQPDGSANIRYTFTFENYGSPIDVVDIGTPGRNYTIANMRASIDGQPLTDIRPSTYIDVGIEVHLHDNAIRSGETGTLHFEFVAPEMVYADTTDDTLASVQITPTWFGSDVVRGTGDIEIRVRTIPDVDPDDVLYQDVAFYDKFVDDQGRVVAVWRYEDVSPTRAYRVGVSFPRDGIDRIVEITFWDLVGRWLGRILPVLGSLLGCLPTVLPVLFLYFFIRAIVRSGKPNYLPPIAQVEGGGIKRGLTAPEAAVILELPLNKILGLVIFGMLEKGLVRQTKADPLTVEVAETFRVQDKDDLDTEERRHQFRRHAAQQQGTVIHQYEYGFLDLIEKRPDTPISKLQVVKPMEELVNEAAAKMKGFDLSDTQDYYRRVIDRAVAQATALGDIEQREAYLDRYLPWVMMQRDYRPAVNVGGYHYWPRWARQARAGSARVGAGGQAAAGGTGRSTTTFGDVSASFAGWADTTMGAMATAILPTALSKPSLGGTSRGSSGSSCACACAGCACACACAGGGR